MRTERIQVICTFDPAVDWTQITYEDALEYVKTREPRLVRRAIRPGANATVFHLREIPHALWDSYVIGGPDSQRAMRAFRCAVERVENFYQRDGVFVEDWRPTKKADVSIEHQIMNESEVALFSGAEREEVGTAAYMHSFFPRRIERCLQAPPLSLAWLMEQAFRRAEQSQQSAASSSERPSDSTTQSQDTTDKPPGTGDSVPDEATAAAAQATG